MFDNVRAKNEVEPLRPKDRQHVFDSADDIGLLSAALDLDAIKIYEVWLENVARP